MGAELDELLMEPERGTARRKSKHTRMKKTTSTGVFDWAPSERRKKRGEVGDERGKGKREMVVQRVDFALTDGRRSTLSNGHEVLMGDIKLYNLTIYLTAPSSPRTYRRTFHRSSLGQ